jgi:serine/threonine protein kinase
MVKEQPVPGYNVVHIIGQGGQAQVYLAEREHDGLRVALKVLNRALRNDPVFLERFVREYKLVASVDSAYVARIYDQGFTGDHPYIAMEFLPSGTLASRIREGLTTRAALRIAAWRATSPSVPRLPSPASSSLRPAI